MNINWPVALRAKQSNFVPVFLNFASVGESLKSGCGTVYGVIQGGSINEFSKCADHEKAAFRWFVYKLSKVVLTSCG